MIECTLVHDAILDVALGSESSEALTKHLRTCPECARELARQQILARRLDSAVGALVRLEPADGLVRRITARAHGAERRRRGWWDAVGIGAALAACAVALVIGLHSLQAPARVAPDTTALMAWRSPTLSLLDIKGSVLRAPLDDPRFSLTSKPTHHQMHLTDIQ